MLFFTKEMGVKTDRNGFLTEDGLVAFYRDFGRLGDDIEAAGVSRRFFRVSSFHAGEQIDDWAMARFDLT